MSTLTTTTTTLGFALRLAVFGVGLAIFQSPNNSAIMGAVPRTKLGIASGLIATSRTLGQTSGLPLMGALFTAQVLIFSGLPHGSDVTAASAAALVSGVNVTYRMAAWVMLFSTLLAALALWLDYRNTEKTKNTEGMRNTEKMREDESTEGIKWNTEKMSKDENNEKMNEGKSSEGMNQDDNPEAPRVLSS